MDLSLVIPVYNEVESLATLAQEVREALSDHGSYEVVFVDDGSTDGSRERIHDLSQADARVRGILLDRNYGQTAAFLAGFKEAQGEVVVTLDADLQNDPRDIGKLLDALPGHDVVAGVRADRHDSLVRILSGRIANRIRSWATGDGLTDVGCSLKAFRRPVLAAFPPYRGMHRFFGTLALLHGFKVKEVPVSHRARSRGQSKYGLGNRTFAAFHDLLGIIWIRSRLVKPSVAERVAEPAATNRS